MNTFLINASSKTVVQTKSSAVVEKSNNIEDIQFIVEKMYIGVDKLEYDLSEFDFVVQYILPISKTVKSVTLIGEDYEDDYLLYRFTSTSSNLTSEPGTVEMSLSFLKTELDAEGQRVNYVLEISNPAELEITPLVNWFSASDEQLSKFAELYLNNKAQIEALTVLAQYIEEHKADDITISANGEKLILTNNGAVIGEGVDLSDLNEKLVDIGSETTGNLSIITI